jgi:hypothetical protein
MKLARRAAELSRPLRRAMASRRGIVPALVGLGGLALLACGSDDESPDACADITDDRVRDSRVTSVGGIAIYRKCSEVATWNHEADGVSLGEIIAPLGATTDRCEVRFLDLESPREPVTDRRAQVPLTDDCLELGATIADGTVAAIEPAGAGDPWGFTVRGKRVGRTTATFTVRWSGGATEVQSGPIDIVVEDLSIDPGPDSDIAIVLNGVRLVFAIDDTLAASCGSTVADPGYVPATVGTITDGHISVRFLEPGCSTQTLGAENHLAYEFRDPCIAAIVDHPEHFGVLTSFHMEGLTAGSTEMRVRIFEGQDIVYRSPWIPVVVTE